jgi:hypothetical protein
MATGKVTEMATGKVTEMATEMATYKSVLLLGGDNSLLIKELYRKTIANSTHPRIHNAITQALDSVCVLSASVIAEKSNAESEYRNWLSLSGKDKEKCAKVRLSSETNVDIADLGAIEIVDMLNQIENNLRIAFEKYNKPVKVTKARQKRCTIDCLNFLNGFLNLDIFIPESQRLRETVDEILSKKAIKKTAIEYTSKLIVTLLLGYDINPIHLRNCGNGQFALKDGAGRAYYLSMFSLGLIPFETTYVPLSFLNGLYFADFKNHIDADSGLSFQQLLLESEIDLIISDKDTPIELDNLHFEYMQNTLPMPLDVAINTRMSNDSTTSYQQLLNNEYIKSLGITNPSHLELTVARCVLACLGDGYANEKTTPTSKLFCDNEGVVFGKYTAPNLISVVKCAFIRLYKIGDMARVAAIQTEFNNTLSLMKVLFSERDYSLVGNDDKKARINRAFLNCAFYAVHTMLKNSGFNNTMKAFEHKLFKKTALDNVYTNKDLLDGISSNTVNLSNTTNCVNYILDALYNVITDYNKVVNNPLMSLSTIR